MTADCAFCGAPDCRHRFDSCSESGRSPVVACYDCTARLTSRLDDHDGDACVVCGGDVRQSRWLSPYGEPPNPTAPVCYDCYGELHDGPLHPEWARERPVVFIDRIDAHHFYIDSCEVCGGSHRHGSSPRLEVGETTTRAPHCESRAFEGEYILQRTVATRVETERWWL